MTSIKKFRAVRAAFLSLQMNGLGRRIVAVGLLAAISCLEPGCAADYASSDPAFPGDFQARHPIALASAPTLMDIYPVGGALDPRSVANLRSFARRYRDFGSGEIVILVPGRGGSNARVVSEIRRALRSAGLRGPVGENAYVPYRSDGAAPIRVAFMSLVAEVKTPCGLWPEDLASGSSLEGWKNESLRQFRMRDPIRGRRSGRRPARFRSTPGSGPVGRSDAHPGDRRRAPGPGPGHVVVHHPDAHWRDHWRDQPMTVVTVVKDAPSSALPQIEPIPRISIQAFCETAEVAALIEAAAADRRLAKANVRHSMGGATAAIETFQEAPTPNVIVLEAPREGELIERLDQLALLCDAGTKVVVIGGTNDITLYRKLVARGVNEYLVAPVQVVDFLRALSDLFRAPGARPLGRLIGVVGAKGGVGASTIAHNLAWSLASVSEMATIIADFDLAFGTAALNYNQDPPQGVADAVFDPDRVDATLVDRVLSKCGERLSLLAAPAILDRTLDFPETSFDTLLDALRAAAPLTVLDLPHVWNAWARRTLVAADEVVVVANPDLANLRNAKNLIDFLKGGRPHDHPPRLVLNAVGMMKRPEIAATEFAKTVEIAPVAVIPHDAKLFGSAANNGQMIGEIEPRGKAAQIFVELASTIVGRRERARSGKGFLNPVMARFARVRA